MYARIASISLKNVLVILPKNASGTTIIEILRLLQPKRNFFSGPTRLVLINNKIPGSLHFGDLSTFTCHVTQCNECIISLQAYLQYICTTSVECTVPAQYTKSTS